MAVSDKKTLNTLENQHVDMLKDQVNLYKEINILIEENQKSTSAIQKSLVDSVRKLSSVKNFEENINQSLIVEKNLSKEINGLKQVQVFTHSLLNIARRAGNNLLKNQLAKQERSIQKEIRHTQEIKQKLKEIRTINTKLRDLSNAADDLIRKSEVASALGFSKMSGWLTSLFPKVSFFFGKNIKGATAVLDILRKWYYPIIIVGTVLGKIFEIFKEMDKAFFDFRKQWGLTREDSKQFENRLFKITKQTTELGVKFEDVVDSMTKLSKEAGSLNYISDETIKNISILNKQLGISTEISSKFLKTLSSVSQKTIESQRGLLGVVFEMSRASKVSLPEVMDDIAKASASSYAFISRNPIELIKASVEARKFGSSLSSLTNTSKSLLNFTESIQSEMEASVLMGESINLQYARQLAYSKDFVGLNKEIVRLAKEFNFNQMDPFQAQAFARALGKSEEELGKILQSSEEVNALEVRANMLAAQGNMTLRKQLDTRNAMLKANEEELKDLGKRAEKNFETLRNQERLTEISNRWRSIFVDISELLIPIIDKLLIGVRIMMPIVGYTIKLTTLFVSLKMIIASTNTALKVFGSSFKIPQITLSGIWNFVKSIGSKLFSWIPSFRTMGSWTTRIGTNLLKWLGPISKITAAFMLGWEAGKMLTNIFPSINIGMQKIWGWLFNIFPWVADLPYKIWDGIKSVSESIYNSLKYPFVKVWDWLTTTFFGNSPSELGLLILKGISSVSGTLFDFLINPFKAAFNFIGNLFGNKIQPSIEYSVVKEKMENVGVPIDKLVSDKEVKSYRELDNVSKGIERKVLNQPEKPENSELLTNILYALNKLNDNLMSGKIQAGPINLDGQLISTNMNRGIKFRGNYGAMVEG